MNQNSIASFESARATAQKRIEEKLLEKLSSQTASNQLLEGMRYACLSGGKRIRPILIYATADALHTNRALVDTSAVATELIHCYSLVHDDLPAMDNDSLRRGKPTCHIKFDEATAILVGDALQSLAYETIASDQANLLTPETRIQLLQCLAIASGTEGMAAGQMLDLEATGHKDKHLSLEHLEHIHALKTGALISSSVEMACIACNLQDHSIKASLLEFAKLIGLAFQVRDDILDVVGKTEQLGKQAGSDLELDKLTFPGLLGLDAAKDKAHQLIDKAISSIAHLDSKANFLRQIAEFIVARIY